MRQVSQGGTAELLVLFTDGNGDPVDPTTGPFVDIFDADNNPSEEDVTNADALVLNASTTSLGDGSQQGTFLIVKKDTGLYSYKYTVDPDAVTGTWFDRWSATIGSGDVETVFEFTVNEAVNLESFTLGKNMKVVLTLDSSISNTDGDTLGSDKEYWFYTTLNPYYVSTDTVLLEVGAFIRNMPEDTIALSIHKASIEADVQTFKKKTNSEWYEWLRQQYVLCRVAAVLLNNASTATPKYKRLGDLEVAYDTQAFQDKLTEFSKCYAELKRLLNAGGLISEGSSLPLGSAVKSGKFIDRPAFGRTWDYDPNSTSRPGSNVRKYTSLSGKRVTHTWDDNPKQIIIRGPNKDGMGGTGSGGS